jgi:hypothetical protein
MSDSPNATLLAELVHALHDESDALVADDAVRLIDATSRKEHLLRLLAPQANALRAMRRSGADERERLACEAARLMAVDGHAMADPGSSRASAVDQRFAALRATQSD